MAFSQKKTNTNAGGIGSTIIGKGATITGDITTTEQLHIDGVVEGKVSASDQMSVGLSGRVVGEVEAKRLIVSGVVEGKVSAEIVEITAKGDLNGEVICKRLIINDGGFFQGDCKRMTEDSTVTPISQGKKPESGEKAAS